MSNIDKTEERTTIKDELKQKLTQGIKDTLDSEKFANWCQKQGKLFFNNYSFNNALLTYMQKPDASYVMGYENWKDFGRQVKQGAIGIKIFAPVYAKEYGVKGSLFATIKKVCKEQLDKDNTLEFASYRLGQSKIVFNLYRNGLLDVKADDRVLKAHATSDEIRKFIDTSIIGKIPTYYNAVTVFDEKDTTSDTEYLWVSKEQCKKNEMVLTPKGEPITNSRGQVKIYNTDERKARFNIPTDMALKEHDTEKMQILYEVIKKISEEKGVPFSESTKEQDETLVGALGYYRHPSAEYEKGNIVLRNDLSITDKVSVAFHEMAHSDLHQDIEKLKKEMGNEVDKITTNMKEIQAEAVAYMTASTFGIETEHKSFQYIAEYTAGRELAELEKSLDLIYKESQKLLKSIDKELNNKGFNMAIEPIDKTPLSEEQKLSVLTDTKSFIINNNRLNERILESVLSDLKDHEGTAEYTQISEQALILMDISKKLKELDTLADAFEQSNDKAEQIKLQYQMKAVIEKVNNLKDTFEQLSNERQVISSEQSKEEKKNMWLLFKKEPLKALDMLKEDFPEIAKLDSNEIKYLARSNFIKHEFAAKHIGKDNKKFVELSLKQLANVKKVLSDNKTVVEISKCEQWSDTPIFEKGTVAHPKIANIILASAEKQIRDFKTIAEKKDEYYPYSKCEISIFTTNGKGGLSTVNTRIDIGDGTQKDIVEHMSQVCKGGKGEQEILSNFIEATKEKKVAKDMILTPKDYSNDGDSINVIEKNKADNSGKQSMSEWKVEISKSQEDMGSSIEKENKER